jgi:PAS domain S-box-containing protein
MQHNDKDISSAKNTNTASSKTDELGYKTVLEQMADGVCFFAVDSLQILYVNRALQQQLGRTKAQLLALKIFNIQPDLDKASLKYLIKPLVEGQSEKLHFNSWLLNAQAEKVPVELAMYVREGSEASKVIITIVRDMSKQQKFVQLGWAAETYIHNLLQRSDDALAIINKQQRIIDCNQAALDLFGFKQQSDMLGLIPRHIGVAKHQQQDTAPSAIIERAWQEGYQRFNWLHNTPRSAETPMEVTLTPILYKAEPCLQVLWRDLTEAKEKERKIKQLAYFDELTGLANKNLFAARLHYLLAAAKSNNYTVAVIYFDIIKLAEVNETMGYTGGDKTIKAVAQRFAEQIRNAEIATKFIDDEINLHVEININDINREFDSLARIHADKFSLAAVLTDSAAASILTERIQEVIKQPLNIMGHELTVSVRAGVALYPDDATDLEMLIRGANIALGYAKEQQLSHCFYSSALGDKVQRRALIIKRLEHTLMSDNPSFSLRYQPQIDLITGRLSGVEVLIRWCDDVLGWVTPAVFIPLAEERGLINPITTWVLDTAGKQLVQWQQAGYHLQKNSSIKLAINISAKSLDVPNIVSVFVDKLQLLGLSPLDFEIELTETGIMRDPTHAIDVLHQLKQQGFKLAIDDFGTGHSSLSYLKNINADILKIDMCFVQSLLTDTTNHAIVKTVIATAKIFGMHTLAEGVEDLAIAEELTELGCHYGQGYFYAKPLTAKEFEKKWLGATLAS